ncbi:MAG: CDF family Co(II)/Ni(II) efflux transporter DmeF, partial [Roseiarcus sp.]
MHDQSVDQWRHPHIFLGQRHDANERRTIFVVLLTTAMMIAEIAGGAVFGSMALIADGWHMSTHAVALGIAAAAYALARRFKNDPRFAFGAGKLGDLAAFASAIVLVMIAGFIAYESLTRIGHPVPIAYGEAIVIAALGLAVNLFSAFLLRGRGAERGHSHGRDHGEADGSSHAYSAIFTPAHGDDNNLRAAYLHVMADAGTSVAAILGLILARRFEL